jgi:hypothetical protein
MEIHAVFLDIKKAYDSVCRILGKDVAMRRLGLPEEVIELFSEIDRGNQNRVRTAGNWVQTDDDWDNPEAYTFTAESGFTQGATESPFLWVMFYDMVLAALQELGVGNSVRLGTHGFNSIEAGLIALADDTTILERTRDAMQRSLGSLSRVLRLAHLQVAPEKSIHTALQWTVVNGTPKFWLQEELVAKGKEFRVTLDGRTIPFQDHDEELRHVGYWISPRGETTVQLQKVLDHCSAVELALKKAKTAGSVVKYIWNAVLTPRILYPLTVVSPREPVATIERLERQSHAWLLKRINVHASFPKDLLRGDKLSGGLGLESWVSAIGRSRAELANNLIRHEEPDLRRLAWHMQLASRGEADQAGRISGWWNASERLWKEYKFSATSWFNTGGRREQDVHLSSLILEVEHSMEPASRAAWTAKRRHWNAEASIQWLSDMVDMTGTRVRPAWKIDGYHWLETLVHRLAFKGRIFSLDMCTLREGAELGKFYQTSQSLELEAIFCTVSQPGMLRGKLVYRNPGNVVGCGPQIGRIEESFTNEEGQPSYVVEWLRHKWDEETQQTLSQMGEGWITWQAAKGCVWPARCSEDRLLDTMLEHELLPVDGAVVKRNATEGWRGGATWWKQARNGDCEMGPASRLPDRISRIMPPGYTDSPAHEPYLEEGQEEEGAEPEPPRRTLRRLKRGPAEDDTSLDSADPLRPQRRANLSSSINSQFMVVRGRILIRERSDLISITSIPPAPRF